MKTLPIIFLLVTSFLSLPVLAKWDRQTRAVESLYENPYNPDNAKLGLGYFPTVYALIVAGKKSSGLRAINLGKEVSFDSPRFLKKSTYFLSQRKHKAPLAILVPNLMQDHKSMLYLVNLFAKKGFHVLSLPTALSMSYLKQKPVHPLGDLKSEALNHLESIDRAIGELSDRNLLDYDDTQIIGISYGALLALMIKNLDSINDRHIDQATVICPPSSLSFAAKQFDKLFEENKRVGAVQLISKYLSTKAKIKRAQQVKDVSEGVKRDYLVLASNRLSSKIKKTGKQYKSNFAPKTLDKWLKWDKKTKNINAPGTFEELFSYAKKLNPNQSFKDASVRENSLLYWYRQEQKTNPGQVRVLSSTNDDLVEGRNYWRQFSSQDVMLLNGGGHCGFAGTDWFYEDFLPAAFF